MSDLRPHHAESLAAANDGPKTLRAATNRTSLPPPPPPAPPRMPPRAPPPRPPPPRRRRPPRFLCRRHYRHRRHYRCHRRNRARAWRPRRVVWWTRPPPPQSLPLHAQFVRSLGSARALTPTPSSLSLAVSPCRVVVSWTWRGAGWGVRKWSTWGGAAPTDARGLRRKTPPTQERRRREDTTHRRSPVVAGAVPDVIPVWKGSGLLRTHSPHGQHAHCTGRTHQPSRARPSSTSPSAACGVLSDSATRRPSDPDVRL